MAIYPRQYTLCIKISQHLPKSCRKVFRRVFMTRDVKEFNMDSEARDQLNLAHVATKI